MEEIMTVRSVMEHDEAVEMIQRNVALTKENKRLKTENEELQRQNDNLRLLLKHEGYLANRYREYRRGKFTTVRGWLRRAWDSMDETWAVRVIIGTVIMSLAALGIAELFPKILY